MRGDWTKMRTDLYRDPKVCRMADHLLREGGEFQRHTCNVLSRDSNVTRNVMRNVTVGVLVTVWGVTRHRGKRDIDDLYLKGATLQVIDDIAETPGFGGAMAEVGWVKVLPHGLVFPNFFRELNVDPQDNEKAKAAERQRRHREKMREAASRDSNVTVTSQSNVRGEESRVEERDLNTIPLTPLEPKTGKPPKKAKAVKYTEFSPENFQWPMRWGDPHREALRKFVAYKTKIGSPLMLETYQSTIEHHAADPELFVRLVDRCVRREWKGLNEEVPLEKNNSATPHKAPFQRDTDIDPETGYTFGFLKGMERSKQLREQEAREESLKNEVG